MGGWVFGAEKLQGGHGHDGVAQPIQAVDEDARGAAGEGLEGAFTRCSGRCR